MRQQVINNLKSKIRELESRCNVIKKHLQDFPNDEFKKDFYHYDIEKMRMRRLWDIVEKI